MEIPHKVYSNNGSNLAKSFIGKEIRRVMDANQQVRMVQTGYGTAVEQPIEETEVMVEKETKQKNTKRVTKAQYAANKQKMDRYATQEAKRAPKIQIDQKLVLGSWITGILVAFIASAIVSFNGITAVAKFVGLSADWMSGLFFFFVELMYLLFLIAYLVLASRVDENGKPEKTWGAVTGMIGFAAIAVAANAFHTFDFWKWDWTQPQMYAGVVLAISAPIAIISASKMASRVVFAKAISL